MSTYKTPDVYVEEISIFPPSVAEVATAIPAFIGYTEKALKNGVEDVSLVPTRVKSLAEYKEIFGEGPAIKVKAIELDANNVVTKTEIDSTYYMYDAIRMFYNNGGGTCYIISIGAYGAASPSKTHFEYGLEKLKKQDEPTIILFPDAILLAENLYEVQKKALQQCKTLGDRVAVFDLLEAKASDSTFDWQKGVDEFRTKIGINYLKYGAAYTPYLKTNLTKKVRYSDIKAVLKKSGSAANLKNLTTETKVIATIELLDYAISDETKVNGADTVAGSIKKFLKDHAGGASSLKAGYYDQVLAIKTKVNQELAK